MMLLKIDFAELVVVSQLTITFVTGYPATKQPVGNCQTEEEENDMPHVMVDYCLPKGQREKIRLHSLIVQDKVYLVTRDRPKKFIAFLEGTSVPYKIEKS